MMATIQLRRGTAAQWAAANPVLAVGELGFVVDAQVLKVGDGVTAFADLVAFTDADVLSGAVAGIAAMVQTEATGLELNPAGVFDVVTLYVKGDVIAWGNAAFVITSDAVGADPADGVPWRWLSGLVAAVSVGAPDEDTVATSAAVADEVSGLEVAPDPAAEADGQLLTTAGGVWVATDAGGLRFTAPGGSQFTIAVGNDGSISTSAV